ncbi:hypothetical protein RsTz2092_04800 [Deferribacterales bacterium RsTz2092]|nr:hypothetical protein AGMMS49941_02570 [Deferribacterales bacterium]
MNIVNAIWEERNLGLKTLEITINTSDMANSKLVNDLRLAIEDAKAQYVIVRLPAGSPRTIHELQDADFYYMETQLEYHKMLTGYQTPVNYTKLASTANIKTYHKDKASWQLVISKIEDGMFMADRVYLDPKIDYKLATKRYRNWIMDLFEQEDTTLYTVDVNGSEVGFGVLQLAGAKATCSLHGVYKPYQGRGYGALLLDTPLKIAVNDGATEWQSRVSSNNVIMTRLYDAFDFQVKSLTYVMRWLKS